MIEMMMFVIGFGQCLLDCIVDIVIYGVVVVLLGLVVVQGWQVFVCYVINDLFSWIELVMLLLLVMVMSLGVVCGVYINCYFGFFLLYVCMGFGLCCVVDVLVQLVVVVLGGFIVFWLGDLLFDGLDIKIVGVDLLQSINYLLLVVGGGLMLLFVLNCVWNVLQVCVIGVEDVEGDC